MNLKVLLEVRARGKLFAAVATRVRLLPCVYSLMSYKIRNLIIFVIKNRKSVFKNNILSLNLGKSEM